MRPVHRGGVRGPWLPRSLSNKQCGVHLGAKVPGDSPYQTMPEASSGQRADH